ncbi:uncharacterized protein K489DRAFT_376930 [Dissoconium aciculare CBS 342.82]|uniref:LIM zinc-binding domain-containing protein n=1 Tax=Dissoconium aciculare CBS 342.82 TaxID=1314786 RepID=A0A6J3MET8_9PEZI|nr:uncharacterized protein K489DRAFT_376930 [Dissoconium aciculare CBS 342.82]KAF1826515.1 hypothetical protein K489DRAFT_376930 [Dissoconium aciculare CBS 342.82]
MSLRHRDRPVPEPTYMSKEQTVQYLAGLRQSQPSRPSGSRPAPPSKFTRTSRTEISVNGPQPSFDSESTLPPRNSMQIIPPQKLTHRKTESSLVASDQTRKSPFAGRPLARAPSATDCIDNVSIDEHAKVRRTPSMTYIENGMRWMEKQEARSLRRALEDMDLEEERAIHAAAQDEAAQLVWKHRNPDAVYRNVDAVKDYRSHLRKGSYQRSISQSSGSIGGRRSPSDGSIHSASGEETIATKQSVSPGKASAPTEFVSVQKRRSVSGKSYDGLAQAVASDVANGQRRVSSGSRRMMSCEKTPFVNPHDRIWEDPQEDNSTSISSSSLNSSKAEEKAAPHIPAFIRKNPFARVRMQHDRLERANSAPVLPAAAPVYKHDRVEIQRNEPSQSRNPWYMSNEPLPPASSSPGGAAGDETSPKAAATRDGKEIRSDDLRAATSKSRQDYSPKLPRPTLVSDKPGRPIVSFEKPKEVAMQEVRTSSSPTKARADSPRTGEISANRSSFTPSPITRAPPAPRSVGSSCEISSIPRISFPDESTPAIILPPNNSSIASTNYHRSAPPTPSINIEPPSITISDSSVASNRQNAPSPSAQRPPPIALPHHPHSAPAAPDSPKKSSLHYTPSLRQSGVLCTQCALPIAGRILSAAGQRFHPGCFVCHECNTNLECVAFYPEPEQQQRERAADPNTFAADASSLRFYCHLDFHELFSPRCKSCKTPIEGEGIVACGANWHPGHFFCAQCGDSFDQTMPFVEKEGYAWCVGCHANRFSSKCKGCRKPIVEDVVVKALGADWHGGCFCCTECKGEFDDGRYFLRGESQDPVCVRCEERRLKA